MIGGRNRCRIIEAARRLFTERGYAQTSVGDVAAEAGLLKGNLSYYFRAKSDLLADVLAARRQALWDDVTRGVRADAGARAAIEGLLAHVERSAPDLAAFGCPHGTLIGELGKDDAQLQPAAAGLLIDLQRWLVQQFSQHLPVGQAEECAEHLLSVLQGAAVLSHAQRTPSVVLRQVAAARRWLDVVLWPAAP